MSVERAIEAVFSHTPTTPGWPQLPKLNRYEGMFIQYLEGVPGWTFSEEKVIFKRSDEIIEEYSECYKKVIERNIQYFAITSKFAAAFEPFLEEVKKRDKIEIVKGQVIGPITFLTSHNIPSYGMLIKDDGYKELIPQILGLKAIFQVERFRATRPDADIIIFFDEPILSQIGSAVTSINLEEAREILSQSLSTVNCYKGIHICGNSDWDFILSLPIDIINFDAYNFGEEFLLYERSIRDFIERGGYIALGIVPTDSETLEKEEEDSLLERASYYLLRLENIIGKEALIKKTFLTPSCGMGSLTVEEAIKVLRLLSFLTNVAREKSFFA